MTQGNRSVAHLTFIKQYREERKRQEIFRLCAVLFLLLGGGVAAILSDVIANHTSLSSALIRAAGNIINIIGVIGMVMWLLDGRHYVFPTQSEKQRRKEK